MNFYIYFLAKLDKHDIKIIKGYDHDDNDRSWVNVKECKDVLR